MKQRYFAAGFAFAALQLVTPLWAEPTEESATMTAPSMEERHEKRESKMLEKMTEKLSLTSDQQKSMKALLEKQGDKMEAVNKEAMEKRKAIHSDTDAEIEKLLTPDQKKEFEKWKTERKPHPMHRVGDHK